MSAKLGAQRQGGTLEVKAVDQEALREALLDGLLDYHRAVADETSSEHAIDAMLDRLDDLAPHASVSDLVFYGEKSRSNEEVADEAVRRELIFREQGEFALLIHIEAQVRAALASGPLDPPYDQFAEAALEEVTSKIRAARGEAGLQ